MRRVMFRARSISARCAGGVVRRRPVSVHGRAAGDAKQFHACRPAFSISLRPDASDLASRTRQKMTGTVATRSSERLHSTLAEGDSGARAKLEVDGDRVPPEAHKDPERTTDLLWKLQELGRSNDSSRGDEALRLLQEGRREGIKDLRVYNATLRALSGLAKSSTIETTMAQLREDGLQPDVHIYNFVIYGFAFNKDEGRAVQAYEKMLEEGIAPDNRTLSNLIIAYSWGDLEEMRRVLKEMKEKSWWPTRGAYHSMIPAMRRHEDLQGIYEAMHDMDKEGRAPNDPAFAVAFWAARRLGDPDFAKLLLEMRSKAEYPPRQDFFVQVMLTLRDADRHEELLAYWRQLVCVNGLGDLEIAPETFILALRSAARIRAWDEIEVILKMMQARDISSGEVYPALLAGQRSLSTPGEVEQLAKLFEELESRTGVAPRPSMQLRLAGLWARTKVYDKAMLLFEGAISDRSSIPQETRDLLVRTLVHLERYAEAKETWLSTPDKDKAKLRGLVFQTLMRAAQKLGDTDWAVELHECCLAAGKKTQSWFHPIPIKMLAEAGRLPEAVKIVKTLRDRQHPKLPLYTYNLLCRRCREEGNAELAVEIVQEMRRGTSRYVPYPDLLNFVIGAFVRRGRAREIVDIFEQLCAQNRQPDPKSYVLMADAAAKCKDMSRAHKYIAEAEKRGLTASPEALAYAEGNKPEDRAAVVGQ